MQVRTYLSVWEYATSSSVYSVALDSDGNVFCGNGSSKLTKISPTGTKVWEYVCGGIVYGVTVGNDGYIYTADSSGKVTKITQAGTKVWEYSLGSCTVKCVKVDSSGNVYCGDFFYKLTKISSSGTKVWDYLFTNYVMSIALDSTGNNIYVGDFAKKVTKISSGGGKVWEYVTGSYLRGVIVNSSGYIYCVDDSPKLTKLSSDGTKVWDFAPPSLAMGVALDNNENVFCAGSRYISKVSPDGNLVLNATILNNVYCIAVVDNNYVYIGDESGKVSKVQEGVSNYDTPRGSVGMTLFGSNYDDNTLLMPNLGFDFYYNSINCRSSVYTSGNSWVSIGNNTAEHLRINRRDAKCQNLYYSYETISGLSAFRIRWEGSKSYTTISSDQWWELIFFSDNTMELIIERLPASIDGVSNFYTANGTQVFTAYTWEVGKSYVLKPTGINGTTHTITQGVYPVTVTSPAPSITVKSFTKSKISDETGMTTCTVVFQSDQDLSQWEARADGNGQGSGLLVGSGTTVIANTDVSFDVTYDELTLGDKTYRINIYGKNTSGSWSIYG